MAHLTDTNATNAQATPRRSSRPKASKEQVSNVNTQEQTMTTSTAAAPAADTTFADVADATAGTTGTPGTSAPEAQPAAAPKASTTDGYIKVRVFVLATTQDGTPEFFTAMVGTTAEEVAAKKHHGKAARKAANEGYKWPMTVFDEHSTAARQLDVMAGRQRDAMNRA
ncbi:MULTISPECIES: hypothetical protein [Burkholderia]|uniref:hypothetical protein n=1 Tax=Burkholderia TaxID=32008 RepID=UPI00163F27DE|nr:hypothetical protein [Burkholderia gladioli]